MKIKIPLLLLLFSINLTSCFPTVFTAATGSVIGIAKDDRTAGSLIDDAKISSMIKASFAKNNFRELYTRINVEVQRGKVLYTGTVEREEDAMNAVDIAWKQSGVTEVINELKVQQNSGHFDIVQYTKDSLITTQIKSKLLVHRDIKCINYTIITSKSIVYLFGVARSEEELEKVADIASKIRGVEKVVSHVNIRHSNPHEVKDNFDNIAK